MIKIRETTEDDISEAIRNSLRVYQDGFSLQYCANPQPASIYDERGVLCIIQLTETYPGVVSLSAVLTNNIYANPIGFTRFMKKLLVERMRTLSVHRVQIEVKQDYPAGHKFAKALGFEAEGIMKKFGPDKSDFVLYGKVT